MFIFLNHTLHGTNYTAIRPLEQKLNQLRHLLDDRGTVHANTVCKSTSIMVTGGHDCSAAGTDRPSNQRGHTLHHSDYTVCMFPQGPLTHCSKASGQRVIM